MKHLGDITKINGAEIEPVDVVFGGSPCQNLSVAGKMDGLSGDRSSLFFEQIRVVKEMRDKDGKRADVDIRSIRPRYFGWENVPGAYSSSKGADFQAVLTEIVRIVKPDAPDVPLPKNGWTKSGCIMGIGENGHPFSIAWRLVDAQFWGTPQRRKRIALIADFDGVTAPEILFVSKSMHWDLEQSGQSWEGAAGATGEDFVTTDCEDSEEW
jgi:DNA (cytosine-5)-methyltransferase 1